MRLFLIIAGLMLAACMPANAATWHVSTSGSDSNPGTANQPFRSWQQAVTRATAGDTILIKPGTYRVTGTQGYGVRITRSGTSSAPITLRGDGGRPTLDCSGLTSDWGAYCLDMRASWWRIADINVTGTVQRTTGAWAVGMQLSGSSNNILERFATYRHEGPGLIVTGNSANNRLINCDAHSNYDRRARSPGGNADGISFSNLPTTATGNRVTGCRAWSNSDDGFDLWQSEAAVTIEDSWAFWNGYVPGTGTTAGDGNGFKLGRSSNGPRHRIVSNLAFENRANGFDSNGANGILDVANNTAYKNGGRSYSFGGSVAFRLRNNVSHVGTNSLSSSVQQQANSWQVIGSLSNSDFQSVNASGVDGARQANGALPELGFMRPAANSRLLNRGVDTGIAYTGTSPDLGAFQAETSSVSSETSETTASATRRWRRL